MEQQFYAWQEECLRKWFANNGRGIVQAVTGSGKTMFALKALTALDQREGGELLVRIVVPTAALMKQWGRALREFEGDQAGAAKEIGFCGGGRKHTPNRKYMIYVINSARYELARQILSELREGKKVLLIADECHHYVSGENQLIFEFIPYIKEYEKQFFSIGLSATMPSGEDRKYLISVLGKSIYHYGIQKALRAQTVCRYDVFHIELSLSKEEMDTYQEMTECMRSLYRKLLKKHPELRGKSTGEIFEALRILAGNKRASGTKEAAMYLSLMLRRREIVCVSEARMSCAVELIRRLGIRQKILVFGERIRQAEELYHILQKDFPGKVGRYHSQMGSTANQNVLERFRNGEIKILITCKSLDEGVDIPDASVGIILSGTSVQRQRVQRLGRIIRRQKGKESASLYYLHAVETTEDSCFLESEEEKRVYELQYENGWFYQKEYDTAAGALMKRMEEKGIGKAMKKELLRCMEAGCVRSDWKMELQEIEMRIQGAKEVRDKNYWICMKKLGEEKV